MPEQPHLRIFGQPRLVAVDGRAVRLRTHKQLALLAYLALEGRERPVPRDTLIELLWPDVGSERGRHSLSQALTAIRQALGDGAVSRGGEAVQFEAEVTTDLDVLEAGGELAGADLSAPLAQLDRWGGPALAHWADGARERCLRRVRSRVLEQLRAARSAGALTRVHERAAVLYRVDPYSDVAAHALAERALLEGDVVGAIRLVRAHLARAREELGCNPHPDLARLLRRLEAGRIPAAVRGARPPRSRRREVFVGREDELARLEAVWSEARGGRLRTFLVGGAAGIGKSALIRRFATSVSARAWPAFLVACQEIGRGIPFAAVSELIQGLGRDPAVGGTEPLWLAEASRVTPGLKAAYPGIPDPPSVPAESVRARVAEALVRMLDTVGDGGPVLLVVDDVQHLDPASRDVLHVLLRRIGERPVMLLAAARTDGPVHALADDGSPEFAWHDAVELAPLSAAQAMELIGGLSPGAGGPDERVRATITDLAQGIPYLIEMLLADWEADPADSLVAAEAKGDGTAANWRPPETMRRAFARHYRGLSRTTEHILNVLAVAGRAMTSAELAELLSLTVPEVDHPMLELLDRGILRPVENAFGFKNELHRAFVYYAMSGDSQNHYHTRLANWLRVDLPNAKFHRQLEAAHHFVRAHLLDSAIDATERGAEVAIEQGAPREAEKALRHILELTNGPNASLLAHLSRALVAQGRYTEALTYLQCCASEDADLGLSLKRALVYAEAAHRGRLLDQEATGAAAYRALDLAERAQDEKALLRSIHIVAEVASETGDLRAIDNVRSRTKRLAEHSSSEITRALAEMTAAYCSLMLGHTAEAGEAFRNLIPTFRDCSRDIESARVLNGLGIAQLLAGDFRSAVTTFNDAKRIAWRVGDIDSIVAYSINVGATQSELAMFWLSAKEFQEASRYIKIDGTSARRVTEYFVNTAALSISLGNLSEAGDYVKKARAAASESQLWTSITAARLMEADYHLACADLDSVLVSFETAKAQISDKKYALLNTGRFERLYLLWLWKSLGYHAVAARASDPLPERCLGVGDQLEARVTELWIAQQEGIELGDYSDPYADIMALGLPGLIAYLTGVGVTLKSLPPRQPAETPAQLVVRFYLNSGPTTVPLSVRDASEPDLKRPQLTS